MKKMIFYILKGNYILNCFHSDSPGPVLQNVNSKGSDQPAQMSKLSWSESLLFRVPNFHKIREKSGICFFTVMERSGKFVIFQ